MSSPYSATGSWLPLGRPMTELYADELSLGTWTAETLAAYQDLELPSLHDFLVTQEKLAAEIRRQNREIRALAERVEESSAPPPVIAPKSGESTVIALFDAMHSVVKHTQVQVDGLPQPGFFSSRRKRDATAAQLRAVREGLAIGYAKAESLLTDYGLASIDPKPGEKFDPSQNRAVHRENAETSGLVVRVVRLGLRRAEQIVRPADVIISK